MKLLLLLSLLSYIAVDGTQASKGSFPLITGSKVKRSLTLDKTFRCPEGWNLSFRTCYKSFAPPVAGMTYQIVKDECGKLGAAPAAMRNAAEEIGVQKSLKLFRNSSKITDLIILGVQQSAWFDQFQSFNPARSSLTTVKRESITYELLPFWLGLWDIDDQKIYSRYNKFVPHKTPASTLSKRNKIVGRNYTSDHPSRIRCLTYDSESMLMNEIHCDCSKFKCTNPHEITAVTCSKYAEFNGVSLQHFFNETSKFQSIPDYTKKYKCDPDWTLVETNDTNNIGFETICMKAFRPSFSYVSYHSSEQLCGEYDARPSAPNSDAEAKTALGLLNSLYGYSYNASVYVGVRLLENFVAYEEEQLKANKFLSNGMNEYINDWHSAPWDPDTEKKNETIYVSPVANAKFGLFEKSRCKQYPCANIPAALQHYCVIWEVKYGYRAAPCDPVGYTKPINAVLCSKPPTWKFFPNHCANKTQSS